MLLQQKKRNSVPPMPMFFAFICALQYAFEVNHNTLSKASAYIFPDDNVCPGTNAFFPYRPYRIPTRAQVYCYYCCCSLLLFMKGMNSLPPR